MLSLEKLVASEFGNANLNEVVKKLAEHNLYDFLIESINTVNVHLIQQQLELKTFSVIKISHIASVMLIKFNEYLRQLFSLGKVEEKKELEYLLGNITKRLIKSVIDEVPVNHRSNQLLSIQISLEDTCKLYKYDFGKLSEFIQIDDIVIEVYVQVSEHQDSVSKIETPLTKTPPGYSSTNIKGDKLRKLLQIMVELEITTEIEKFGKLFDPLYDNLAIRLNESKRNYVLQFFVCLKATGFITCTDSCFGFYQVLQYHVLNFDAVFLNNRPIKGRMDLVRKIKSWDINKELFNKRLKELL